MFGNAYDISTLTLSSTLPTKKEICQHKILNFSSISCLKETNVDSTSNASKAGKAGRAGRANKAQQGLCGGMRKIVI